MSISAESLLEALAGAAPVGVEPMGSVGDGVDWSSADPIEALRHYPGELAYLLRVRGWDEDGGIEENFLVSSHGYHTGGDGQGASDDLTDFAHFPAGLENPGTIRVSLLLGGGRLAHGARATFGSITIGNADGRFTEQVKRLNWRRQPYDLWVGRAEWSGRGMDSWAKIETGLVERVARSGDRVTVSVKDGGALLDAEVPRERYLGFGAAVEILASGDGIALDASATFRPAEISFGIIFRVASLHTGVLANYGWEETSRIGWELRAMSDGSLLWVQDDYAPFLVSSSGIVEAGRVHRASFEGDASGTALYLDGVLVASGSAAYVSSILVGNPVLLLGKRASFV